MRAETAREEGGWRAVPGYPGYEVDRFGAVRRTISPRAGKIAPRERRGQAVVRLTGPDGKRKEERTHRLVWLAFMGPAPPGMSIRHRPGDRLDNWVGNLELMDKRSLGRLTGGKAGRIPVVKLDVDGEVLEAYPSARAAARANHMSYQTVMDCCNGKTKRGCAPDGMVYRWDD